jgi:hypothetical protein
MQESRRSTANVGTPFSPRDYSTINNSTHIQGTKNLMLQKKHKAETLRRVRMNAVEKARNDLTKMLQKEN